MNKEINQKPTGKTKKWKSANRWKSGIPDFYMFMHYKIIPQINGIIIILVNKDAYNTDIYVSVFCFCCTVLF